MRSISIIRKKGLAISAFVILTSLHGMLFIPKIAETAPNPFAGKIKLYEFEGRQFNTLIWANSTFYTGVSNPVFIASKTEVLQMLNGSSALLIFGSHETDSKQLTEDEVSVILDWVARGNLLLISDYKTLNASRELMQIFDIHSLVPVEPNPQVPTENMSIWTVNVSRITPSSILYSSLVLRVGGNSSYGLNLMEGSKSTVFASYVQPDSPEEIPAGLLATHEKGTAICFAPDVLTAIVQEIEYGWRHIMRATVDAYTGLLAYMFLKPQEYVDPTSERITLMDENDTLFKKTRSVAEYLNSLDFGVYFTNLAHSKGVGLYRSRLSVTGPMSLFDKIFNTTLRVTQGGYVNITSIIFPDEIRDEIQILEFSTPPVLAVTLPETPETGHETSETPETKSNIPETADDVPTTPETSETGEETAPTAVNISTPFMETLLGKRMIFLAVAITTVIVVVFHALRKK